MMYSIKILWVKMMLSSVIGVSISVFITVQALVDYVLVPFWHFKEHLRNLSTLLQQKQEKIICGNIHESLLNELREAAALLIAKHNAMPVWFSSGAEKMQWLPSRAKIVKSAQHLNFIIAISSVRRHLPAVDSGEVSDLQDINQSLKEIASALAITITFPA